MVTDYDNDFLSDFSLVSASMEKVLWHQLKTGKQVFSELSP